MLNYKKFRIAIDFDGTITANPFFYPAMSEPKKNAAKAINKLFDDGHTIIINTCRAGEHAMAAKEYLKNHGIKYSFFNENDPELISIYGTDTRKISADFYFDDRVPNGLLDWQSIYRLVSEMSKPLIMCIVGESGSGKSLIADYISDVFKINPIQSRTTRPPRFAGETGHTFVSEDEFNTYDISDMIAFTKFGDYRYCCLRKDLVYLNTYVIDEFGLDYLEKNFSNEFRIVSIRIWRPESLRHIPVERIQRDIGRFTREIFDYEILNDCSTPEELYPIVDEVVLSCIRGESSLNNQSRWRTQNLSKNLTEYFQST